MAETPTVFAAPSRWEPTAGTTSTADAGDLYFPSPVAIPLPTCQWRLDDNHHAGHRAGLSEIGARICFSGVPVKRASELSGVDVPRHGVVFLVSRGLTHGVQVEACAL